MSWPRMVYHLNFRSIMCSFSNPIQSAHSIPPRSIQESLNTNLTPLPHMLGTGQNACSTQPPSMCTGAGMPDQGSLQKSQELANMVHSCQDLHGLGMSGRPTRQQGYVQDNQIQCRPQKTPSKHASTLLE